MGERRDIFLRLFQRDRPRLLIAQSIFEKWRSGNTLSLKRRSLALMAGSMIALASLSMVAANRSADWIDGNPLVTTSKEVYLEGETVQINVTCYIPAQFSSTGQCFFVVEDAFGNTVYDLRSHVYVGWVLTMLVPPKTFNFNWNQKNDAGQEVPPGIYLIWGYEAGYHFFTSPPIAGNSTSISIVEDTKPVPTVERIDVNLLQGWNLFSLPLSAPNYTSSSLGLPTGSLVVRWNSTAQLYDGVFIVGVQPSKEFALVEGTGYSIYPSSACTISIYGTVLNDTHYYDWRVGSGGGWVLVGFPKASQTWPARDVSSWTDKSDTVRAVVMWNPGFQMYKTYIPGIDVPPIFLMIAGFGYWVYISESVTVAYGP